MIKRCDNLASLELEEHKISALSKHSKPKRRKCNTLKVANRPRRASLNISMTRPSTPGNKGQDHRASGSKGLESPTNIRNGKDLVYRAIDANEHDRCRTAMIQPQRHMFFMDCRQRGHSEFREHLPFIYYGKASAGRRVEKDYRTSVPKMESRSQPDPESTARLTIGPRIAKVLRTSLQQEAATDWPDGRLDEILKYFIIIEGASGAAVRKLCIAHSAGEAASVMFHHRAKGFSVEFVGAVLSDYNKEAQDWKWVWCPSVDQMTELAGWEADMQKHERKVAIVY